MFDLSITTVARLVNDRCTSLLRWSYASSASHVTVLWYFYYNRQISNISRTHSQKLHDSRLVLQLSLANPLKPGVKLRNEDVVGAAPTGDAPTTSGWPPSVLPTKVQLILEIWRYIYNVPCPTSPPVIVCNPTMLGLPFTSNHVYRTLVIWLTEHNRAKYLVRVHDRLMMCLRRVYGEFVLR